VPQMLGNFRDGGRDESGLSSSPMVGVGEVFNPSPQHVNSEHKPPPPIRPRVTTKGRDPNRNEDGDAKSPYALPVKLTPVELADEASDKSTSDTNSDQDQVGLPAFRLGRQRTTYHILA